MCQGPGHWQVLYEGGGWKGHDEPTGEIGEDEIGEASAGIILQGPGARNKELGFYCKIPWRMQVA